MKLGVISTEARNERSGEILLFLLLKTNGKVSRLRNDTLHQQNGIDALRQDGDEEVTRTMKKISVLVLLLLTPFFCIPSHADDVSSQNLIPNPSFESTSGWQTTPQNGATETTAFDSAKVRTGKQSLKLTKTNGRGFVELRSAKPIHIEPNITYTFRGWFRAEDAPISSLLLFRISTDGKTLVYNSIDRSAGFKSQSLLINSPSNQWEKRVVTYRRDKAEDIYLHVVLWGNPCSVWIDDLELVPGATKYTSVPATYSFPYSEDEVLKQLQNRPSDSAQLVDKNGNMQLQVDGKIQPFVFYKDVVSSKIAGDEEAFGKAGLNVVCITASLGQSRFAYLPHPEKPIWDRKDHYNFDEVDKIILSVLRKNPKAQIILDLWAYPYREWGDENPDDIVRNENGQRAYGIWGDLAGYTDDLDKVNTAQNKAWWYPSYQSTKWRQDSQAAFAAIAQHLKNSVFGKPVIGFFISGGQDLRFFPSFYDYSLASEQSFRAWTLRKYGLLENVAAAWKQPLKSEADIKVPHFQQQRMESGKPYQDVGQLLDYRQFRDEGVANLRDGYAKVLKENIGKPVVTLSYAVALSSNTPRKKNINGMGDQDYSYYTYRNPGYALGSVPYDSYNLHHEKYFQEIDLRSWTGSRGADEIYQMWLGAGLTPEVWDSIHRKMIGASLARDAGFWYFDMNSYFANPFMHQKIKEAYNVAKRLDAMPKSTFRPDVCLVASDAINPYLSDQFTATGWGRDYQQMMLQCNGVPFNRYTLDEILQHKELQNFKVYVFEESTFISTQQRQEIKNKLLNNNRSIVWMGDSGYLSETGKSVNAMYDLIGMHVNTKEQYARRTAIIDNTNNPLTQNVPPFQGCAEMLMAILDTNGGPSSFAGRYQPFWIDDTSATALAHYTETGQTAIAAKQMKGWKSIYLAANQSLGPQLFNNIAKQAGAYVAGAAGQEVDMNGNFASIHALKSGSYTLHLPSGKSRVIDAQTGKVLSDKKSVYTFPLVAQQTYWYFFE